MPVSLVLLSPGRARAKDVAESDDPPLVGWRNARHAAPPGEAAQEPLSFPHTRRYLQAARSSKAGALLVADAALFPGRDLLVCKDPYAALAEILELLHPAQRPPPGVPPSAVVAASAQIGDGASVAAHAGIGEHVGAGGPGG